MRSRGPRAHGLASSTMFVRGDSEPISRTILVRWPGQRRQFLYGDLKPRGGACAIPLAWRSRALNRRFCQREHFCRGLFQLWMLRSRNMTVHSMRGKNPALAANLRGRPTDLVERCTREAPFGSRCSACRTDDRPWGKKLHPPNPAALRTAPRSAGPAH
jgi:hypothetical protein